MFRPFATLLLTLAFACAGRAATSPVTAVSTSGNQLTSLTTGGFTYSQAQLRGGTLTAFAAASTGCILVPAGTGVPASGTRAALVGDWSLDSGVINPAIGPATATVTFPQPIVNRPGPDVVFMEINPGSSSDAMQVTINGVTLPVASAEWGQTGYATAAAVQYSTGTIPATLTALESASLSLVGSVTQNVFGVAIDLSDFGIANGASVSQISFGSYGAATFDPVFIAGISGTGAPPPGPIALPYFEDFSAGTGAFTPASPSDWSLVGGVYRDTITSTSAASSASIQTNALGSDPLTARGFFLSGKFTVISNANSANVVGLALFGTNAPFSGGINNPYYLVEVRPAGSTLRIRRVAINDTQFLPETSLGTFTLNPALPFTIECVGTYENGVLRLAVTVRQGAQSSTFFAVDSEPLTVGYFGFRNRTNGGALTVDCDDFNLRELSTITLTATPDPFARPGIAYSSSVAAISDISAAVVLSAPTRPPWLTFTPGANSTGTLTGTPTATDLGSHTITLAANDDSAGSTQQTFHVSVLEPTGVFISEFLAENDAGLEDENGDNSDWIELFNSDSTTANIGGYWLSDTSSLTKKWAIPAGVTIPAHGFFVVFASAKIRTSDPAHLHTNFKLTNSSGGYLSLAKPDGTLISVFSNYPAQRADKSYGTYGSYTPRGYLLTPTPGAPNDSLGYNGFVDDTHFSVKRGFYTSAQTVTVNCATPGTTLSYTLDSSLPTLTHGVLVPAQDSTSPSTVTLTISSSKILRVAAFAPGLAPSGPDTQSYLFLDDIRSQPATPPAGWPTGKVNGQVLDFGMDTKVTNTVSAQQMKDALAALPTLSLVTELPNLFDPATGIYVNPYGREEGYECPISMELLNADNTPGFHIDAGLRIRGGSSRVATNPKHNFHLYFRSDYGASKLQFPLFGDKGTSTFDRLDLRSTQIKSWHYTNDSTSTYNRDEWSRYTQAAMGHGYTRSRYYHLYIDGQYWGIYGTQERANAAWAASYFGGKKEDYDVLKTYVIPHRVEASDGDNVAWTQLFNMATSGFASDTAYFAVQGLDASGQSSPTLKPLLDIDNLIDYTLLNFYIGNGDGPVNTSVGVPKNFFAIRPRDGRFGFRFLAHDCEDAMNNVDVTGNISTGNTLLYFNPRWLSQQLAANARYRLRFADRAQRALYNGGALDPVSALARWQAFRNQISVAILGESARWGDATSPSSAHTVAQFNSANDSIENTFIPARRATIISQLRARSLFPSLDAPAFSQSGGSISNTTPITITAPAATTITYTLDGSDPSASGAQTYTNPFTLITPQTTVKARAKLNATGEWSALTEAIFTLDTINAAAGNLAITEIHYHPFGASEEMEFVELLNISSTRLDLTGVNFVGAIAYTFSSQLLEPGQRICAVKNGTSFRSTYGSAPLVAGPWTGALKNSSDTIILRDKTGIEIERVTYSDAPPWTAAADGQGRSLIRVNPLANADTATNWRASVEPGGNPGATDTESLAAWLTDHGFATLLADASGIPALLVFATGIDLTAETLPALTVAPETSTPPTALVTFRRRLSADEIALTIQTSPDLSAWQTLTPGTPAAALVTRVANSDGTETLTLRIAAPAPTFVRLRATSP